jgi:hypothetical protein
MPLFSVDIEEEMETSSSAKLLDKIAGADILVVSSTMEIIRLVFKMFLTGVLEFRVRFFKKSHAVDGKFSRG